MQNFKSCPIFLVIVVVAFLVADRAQSGTVVFTDQAAAAGLQVHDSNWMSGGLAWCDIDNDGDFDLFQSNAEGPNTLYENQGDGTFTDITAASGLPTSGWSYANGVICLDYDNNGWRDFYVTCSNDFSLGIYGWPNQLYKNNGDGTFTEVAVAAGVEGTTWSTTASAGDYDMDGHTDIYVSEYVDVWSPKVCPQNMLYHNLGDGTFEEVHTALGVTSAGCTLSVRMFDYDNDGDLDLREANDFGSNVLSDRLFQNEGASIWGDWLPFIDVSVARMVSQITISNMGIAVGDYDNDGWLDTYHSNIGVAALMDFDGSVYTFISGPAGVRSNTPYAGPDAGSGLKSVSWGVAFGDFSLDGWEDLFVTHGQLMEAGPGKATYDPSWLYINNQDGTFSNGSVAAGLDTISLDAGRGLALADYDNDGDMDAIESIIQQSWPSNRLPHLYRNDMTPGDAWLKMRFTGLRSARDAFGTRVFATEGGVTQMRDLNGGDSYQSHHAHEIHFGFGSASTIGSLIVRWPDRYEEGILGQPVNEILTRVEPGLYWLGDADGNRSIETSDMVSAQETVLGIAAQCASSSINVDANPTIGVGDIMLIAQYTNGLRTGIELGGPAGGPRPLTALTGDNQTPGSPGVSFPIPLQAHLSDLDIGVCDDPSLVRVLWRIQADNTGGAMLSNSAQGTNGLFLVTDVDANGDSQPLVLTPGMNPGALTVGALIYYVNPDSTQALQVAPQGMDYITFSNTVL